MPSSMLVAAFGMASFLSALAQTFTYLIDSGSNICHCCSGGVRCNRCRPKYDKGLTVATHGVSVGDVLLIRVWCSRGGGGGGGVWW